MTKLAKYLVFSLVCMFFYPQYLYAQEEFTPFGMTWGDSVKKIESKGIKLTPLEDDIYVTDSLLQNADWAKTYAMLIDKKHGLTRIVAYSDDILNDSNGQRGKRIYYRLRDELHAELVLINSVENDLTTRGLEIPSGTVFYNCLENGPCGPWTSNYVAGNINAQLSLEGLSEDAGYISVMYENSGLTRALQNNSSPQSKQKKPKQ